MVDSGKRARFHRDADNDGKNYKRRAPDRDDKGNDDLIVYRILCPDSVIGSVIGKSGKVINSIRQDTRAKVKVVDPFPGAKFRVITIYCYVREKVDIDVDFEDEFDETKLLCAAQDALLRVHAAIASSLASTSDSENKRRDKEECHILVPSSQSATIIGKGGSSIKKLRGKTRANIRVTPKDAADPTHSCAMDFDNFLVINGDAVSVKKAIYAVSSIMYKFTPKEEIPLDTTVAEAHPSIIIPSDIPIYQPGGLYPSANDSMLSSRSVPPLLGTIPDLQGYADAGNPWPIYSSSMPVVSGLGGASRSEELAIRVLCPFDKIGRVIGKGGSTIKSIRQATGARIEVNDTKEDRDECIITVTATESPDDLKSMAVEAILMLQGKINDEEDTDVSMRLLIPSRVIGCIIGKAGSIVNEIRKRTGADIRISKGKKPRCAEPNDELVEVTGEVGSVRDALIQIALRLRDDVLKEMEDDRKKPAGGGDTQYSGGSGLPFSSMWPSVPPVAPMGYEHRAESGSGLGMVSSSGLYGYGSLPMGENGYRDLSSYTSTMYSGLVAASTIEIMIPSHAVGKVMGKGGANVGNIRKISGAMVEISEPKSSRGDRIAHISGTPEQKRTAENLIQAFIMAT